MGQPVLVHDFRTQLQYSEVCSDESFWESAYRKAFPNFVSFMQGSADSASQRMGIDRVVLLGNGQIIKVDEKKRKKTYGDILLEYVSVDKTGAPGWIEKDLAIDYMAYAFMDTKTVYFFPFTFLRRAWLQFGTNWKLKYKPIEAQNRDYKTISVAVPIETLRQAVSSAMIIKL